MYQIDARASINAEMSGYNVLSERKMAFIVLDKTLTPECKARYIQFGDECETLQDAQKLALFPNLRDPVQVKRPPSKLKLT